MAGADVLLFVVPQSQNNKLIITGKLFEYLASGRPIISVGPGNGDAAAILVDTSREKMVEYEDRNGFKSLIMKYFNEWGKNNGSLVGYDSSALEKYSRLSSTKKLAEIMNEMIKD